MKKSLGAAISVMILSSCGQMGALYLPTADKKNNTKTAAVVPINSSGAEVINTKNSSGAEVTNSNNNSGAEVTDANNNSGAEVMLPKINSGVEGTKPKDNMGKEILRSVVPFIF
ncbi:MAG: putative small lipoprotein YifL [Francisellaceae bacterium]|jgi:predicted small lipoprotein YifL